MNGSIGLAMALALAGNGASAQQAPAPSVSPAPLPSLAPPAPPTDPARLAAARPVIDRVWPLGTYARVMHTMMDGMVQGMMARMFDMTPAQLAASMGMPAGMAPPGGETLGQQAAKDDPYFRQRLDLTMKAMTDEMTRLMTGIEPGIRDALAHSYARRFTAAELGELDRFFATPTGAGYARDQMTLMMSPEMIATMQASIPRIIAEMPAMMARVQAATASLPPAPKKSAMAPAKKP